MPWTTLGNEAPRWAVAVAMPGCRYELWKRTPGRNPDHGVAWLADPLTGSWASVVPGEPGRYDVRQHDPRRLWDEAEAACRWWKDIGEPSPQDWELTITPDNQTVHPTGSGAESGRGHEVLAPSPYGHQPQVKPGVAITG